MVPQSACARVRATDMATVMCLRTASDCGTFHKGPQHHPALRDELLDFQSAIIVTSNELFLIKPAERVRLVLSEWRDAAKSGTLVQCDRCLLCNTGFESQHRDTVT